MSPTRRSPLAILVTLAIVVAGLTGAAVGRHEAMATTGTVTASFSLKETSATTLSNVSATVNPVISLSAGYANGTGFQQISKKWCDRRTIAASGADTLDFAGGLTNEFGAAITFATVKALGVKADSANTNDVWVGGAAGNRFNTFVKDSSVLVVRPGYMQSIFGRGTGYTVTATTGDKLLVKNSAGTTSVTYEICAGGT